MPTVHSGVPAPPPGDTRLWRYMSVDKYLAILADRSLFFANIATFDDPAEGSLPEANRILREAKLVGTAAEGNRAAKEVRVLRVGSRDVTFEWLLEHKQRQLATRANVSCWHANSGESMAMWSLYGLRHAGIAITTSVARLRSCLPESVMIGSVAYHDPNLVAIDEQWIPIAPFFYKWDSYSHEKEVRAVTFGKPVFPLPIGEPLISGVRVPIDPSSLIERVLVAPGAPGFMREVIATVTKALGYEFDVAPSALALRGLY